MHYASARVMRLPAEAPPGTYTPAPSPSRRRSRGGISKRRLRRRGVTGDEERGAGERALMRAVLEDAIRCLAGQVGRSLDRAFLAAKARAWIERRDPSWPFSSTISVRNSTSIPTWSAL